MKKFTVLVFLASIFLTSCEKEKSGYGNYIISISNYTADEIYVTAKLDGENQGSFFIQAQYSVSWSVTSPCDDLVETAGMQNVRIFTYVPNGEHTLELVDVSTGHVYVTDDFSIKADECKHQPFILE